MRPKQDASAQSTLARGEARWVSLRQLRAQSADTVAQRRDGLRSNRSSILSAVLQPR